MKATKKRIIAKFDFDLTELQWDWDDIFTELATMKKITLTKGYEALVSAQDYEMLIKHNWCVQGRIGYMYAIRRVNGKNLCMHRFLLNVTDSSIFVDHINGNTLDNRRSNLRICTRQENAFNSKPNYGRKYKGVCYVKDLKQHLKPWKSYIKKDGITKLLGYFATEIEAALAYNKAAKEVHGVFAYLNEI